MKSMNRWLEGASNHRLLRLNLLLLLICSPITQAAVVYDNVTHPLTDTNSVQLAHFYNREYGDEIYLSGSDRLVTDFIFEYFGDFTPNATQFARVRFYANDGPLADPISRAHLPQTEIFNSGLFTLTSGYNTKWLGDLSVRVPDSFTWTVEFSGVGLTSGNRAGILFYNPPTVGSSPRDFWEVIDGNWTLLHFGANTFKPEANFGARVIAVPEPQTIALFSLGALALWARRRMG